MPARRGSDISTWCRFSKGRHLASAGCDAQTRRIRILRLRLFPKREYGEYLYIIITVTRRRAPVNPLLRSSMNRHSHVIDRQAPHSALQVESCVACPTRHDDQISSMSCNRSAAQPPSTQRTAGLLRGKPSRLSPSRRSVTAATNISLNDVRSSRPITIRAPERKSRRC